MKKSIVAPKPPEQPYSLHDSYISGFEIMKDSLCLLFDKGFYRIPEKDGDDYLIDGRLVIKGIDWDFATFTIQKFSGVSNRGILKGKRYPLRKFCMKHKYYGYNSLLFSGYIHGKKIKEWQLELYYTGDMLWKELG